MRSELDLVGGKIRGVLLRGGLKRSTWRDVCVWGGSECSKGREGDRVQRVIGLETENKTTQCVISPPWYVTRNFTPGVSVSNIQDDLILFRSHK